MFKRLLFLLLLPVTLFSVSKGPEADFSNPLLFLNTYATDYQTKTLYFEGIPILSQDSETNLLSLVPILMQNTVTGEIKMQISLSYYSNDYVNVARIPNALNISSHKRTVVLPILNPQGTVKTNIVAESPTNTKSRKKSETNATQHTNIYFNTLGSMYIFTDEANKIIDLIKDSRDTIPQSLMIDTTVINTSKTKFTPREYSLTELQTQLENNDSKDSIYEIANNQSLHIGRPFDNYHRIVLSFDGGESLLLSPYYTTVLLNFMLFYTHLSERYN